MILHTGKVITRGETSFEVVETINRKETTNNGPVLFNIITWGIPALLIVIRIYQ